MYIPIGNYWYVTYHKCIFTHSVKYCGLLHNNESSTICPKYFITVNCRNVNITSFLIWYVFLQNILHQETMLLPSNTLNHVLLSLPDSFGILGRNSDLIFFSFAEWITDHLSIPNDMAISRTDLVITSLHTSIYFHFKGTLLAHPYKVN